MPIYEYGCPLCLIKEELILPVGERDEPQACPQCGETMLRLHTFPSACWVRGGGADGRKFASDSPDWHQENVERHLDNIGEAREKERKLMVAPNVNRKEPT